MNIKEAKTQIIEAMKVYFLKDELGNYAIPLEKQRPVFLIGAPGIGKTAIMEQIAQELKVGLLSYSMTHHTRQSALGLPIISHKTYGGKEYEISEYTMSEIVASVYDLMEESGVSEGILFLDEINCVSETLFPIMLQFLQYKVFGRHRIPNGWIIVAAGNPPEYNNSVREFDIVTLDRLKRINVEPDYSVWQEYAINKGVHPAITTYLDIKKDDFYHVESTVGGKVFVTPRGWEDLSIVMKLYEQLNIPVTEQLIVQYLQFNRTAKDFAVYYDLFQKYKSEYQVVEILEGKTTSKMIENAKKSKLDERTAIVGILLDAIYCRTTEIVAIEDVMQKLITVMRIAKTADDQPSKLIRIIEEEKVKAEKELSAAQIARHLAFPEIKNTQTYLRILEELIAIVKKAELEGISAPYTLLTDFYQKRLKAKTDSVNKVDKNITNMFEFAEKAFGKGNEILLLVTEMTIHEDTSLYIARHGCDSYYKYNKDLLFYDRHIKIINELLDIDDI